MARIVDQPVIVELRGGRPQAVVFRGQRHAIAEILEEWREIGEWWDQDPAEVRRVYRVALQRGGVAEIEYRWPARQWRLYKLYD